MVERPMFAEMAKTYVDELREDQGSPKGKLAAATRASECRQACPALRLGPDQQHREQLGLPPAHCSGSSTSPSGHIVADSPDRVHTRPQLSSKAQVMRASPT